jgi:hypothetical protein
MKTTKNALRWRCQNLYKTSKSDQMADDAHHSIVVWPTAAGWYTSMDKNNDQTRIL